MKTVIIYLVFIFSCIVASAQQVNIGTELGCLANDGTGIVRCYECWNCDGQLKCYGNCTTACSACYVIIDHYDINGTYYQIDVYENNSLKTTYYGKNLYTVECYEDEIPVIELYFDIYVPIPG
jgi:hypothetical protein